jgi:hypothetical protein
MSTNQEYVIKINEFNIDNIIITPPKLMENKNKNDKTKKLSSMLRYKINDKDSVPMVVELPYLVAPFGVSEYEKNFSITLKAQGDNQEDVSKTFSFLKELDDKFLDVTIQNSQLIYKEKYDETHKQMLIKTKLFNRCVKPSIGKDGTIYPDQISLKFMKNKDNELKPGTAIFRESKKPLEINSFDELKEKIPKGSIRVIALFSVYYISGKAGISVKALCIKIPVLKKYGLPTSYAFSDSIEDSSKTDEKSVSEISDDIKKIEIKSDDAKKQEVKSDEVTPDSEEEEEEEEEEDDSEVEVDDA